VEVNERNLHTIRKAYIEAQLLGSNWVGTTLRIPRTPIWNSLRGNQTWMSVKSHS